MYKIVLIIALKSILFSQDKMILKSGDEVILKNGNNLKTMNQTWYLGNNSKRYNKKNIALITLNNGEIIFRSGMPFSQYQELTIFGKAIADAKASSEVYRNINYDLLKSLDENDNKIYMSKFNDYILRKKAARNRGIACCAIIAIPPALLIYMMVALTG
jgi:hypothetical protein